MSAGLIILIVVIVLLVLLVSAAVGVYNGLVSGRFRVREAWSGIDVQLKRRSSLIPNLVETVRGYASHERETFENVTRARAALDRAGSPAEAAQANNMLTQTLRSLFAVAEAYPELKANENFKQLQSDLTDTEDKIAYARQFYNRNVLSYNEKTGTFPSVIVANMFNFQPEEFFEAEEQAREDVRVSFAPSAPAASTPAGPAPQQPPAPPPGPPVT
jgi:LemA protein